MVKTGLEVLTQNNMDLLGNRRLGLVTQAAAVTVNFTHSLDALLAAGANLSALFGPEHGILGSFPDGANVENGRDARTGLPVYSLYGPNKEPSREMLAGLDALVFDMQDIGVRFYTYISTLVHVLRGAKKTGLPVIVLDRPNPINGLILDGPILRPGFESFIGILPVPIRHGLTIGELAQFANRQLGIEADLTVIPMKGWLRSMWFDQTGLPWVPTSPAIPNLYAATLYVCNCLVEGTNLSEGRGTALPFGVVGAPWLDGRTLADTLNAENLAGVFFRPTAFTPTASKHSGMQCSGVQLHITDRNIFRPLFTGLKLLAACRMLAPEQFKFLPTSWEGRPAHFDLLMGNDSTRALLTAGETPENIAASWGDEIQQFAHNNEWCHLYQETAGIGDY